MRLLVVGASGMLGTDLVEELTPHHETTGVDLPEVDLTRPATLAACLGDVRPEVVLNVAAYTAVDRCEEEREAAFAVNGAGPGHLAEACRDAGAALVHLSTDYVFGVGQSEPAREDDPREPRGAYAESKAAGEDAVVSALPADRRLVVRTQWLFGLHGPNFVEAILRQVDRGVDTLRVVSDQRGRPTWTRSLAAGLRTLVEAGARGTCHVANEGDGTWFDFAAAILERVGADGIALEPQSTAESGRPAPRPAYSVLSLERFADLTGGRLPDWREALDAYLAERAEARTWEARS